MQSLYLNVSDMKVKVLVRGKEVSREQEKAVEGDRTWRFLWGSVRPESRKPCLVGKQWPRVGRGVEKKSGVVNTALLMHLAPEIYMLKMNNMVNFTPCFTIFCPHNKKRSPKGCWISSQRDKICVSLKIKQIALFLYLQIRYSYTLLPQSPVLNFESHSLKINTWQLRYAVWSSLKINLKFLIKKYHNKDLVAYAFNPSPQMSLCKFKASLVSIKFQASQG